MSIIYSNDTKKKQKIKNVVNENVLNIIYPSKPKSRILLTWQTIQFMLKDFFLVLLVISK